MKKLFLAVLAMTLVAATGCNKSPQEKAGQEQQQAAQAQQEGQQKVAEKQKEAAQAQQETQQNVQQHEQNAAQAQQQAAAQGTMATVSGKVAEADSDSITIKQTDGSTVELSVNDNSKITMDGAPAQKDELKNLQEGASVRASYVTQGNEKNAQNIDISGAQPSK